LTRACDGIGPFLAQADHSPGLLNLSARRQQTFAKL
jgi:hypothetical protein